MQTFLPYPSYSVSATTLDPIRHNKQITEGFQIFSTLLSPTPLKRAWSNHPAVLMWKGHEGALFHYVQEMAIEWAEKKDKLHQSYVLLRDAFDNALLQHKLQDSTFDPPPWLGYAPFHAAHRSKLLFKGQLDAMLKLLCQRYGSTYHNWRHRAELDWIHLPKERYLLNYQHKTDLSILCSALGLEWTNYYSQFNWTESDDLEYYWPTKQTEKEKQKWLITPLTAQ